MVAKSGNRLSHVANGQVRTDPAAPLAERLVTLDRELSDVVLAYRPDGGAVEVTIRVPSDGFSETFRLGRVGL